MNDNNQKQPSRLARKKQEVPAIEIKNLGKKYPSSDVYAVKDFNMTVNPGDRVVVGKFTGSDVTIDKVEYKFVKQDDILAVVTD